jgi:hypothetical protein
VAYKFIVASSLSQISYFTSLEVYVLMCFFFILLVAIENAAWPLLTFFNNEPHLFDETYILLAYLAVVTVFNLAVSATPRRGGGGPRLAGKCAASGARSSQSCGRWAARLARPAA